MIPEKLLKEIFTLAEKEPHREICGFLVGKADKTTHIYPVPNAAESPEREFTMEPQAQIDALRLIRKSAMDIVGTFHSHPKTPPVPSAKDRQLGLYPHLVHLIVSLVGDKPEFGLWRITEDGSKKSGTCAKHKTCAILVVEVALGELPAAKHRLGKLRGRQGRR